MSSQDQEDTTIYRVVLNHEEQYSIWPQDRENPLGWRDAGKSGLKAECLDYIKEVWTDMRPLSLRKHMEEAGRNSSPPEEGSVAEEDQAGTVPPGSARDELVNRLSEGNHPVEVSLRPDRTVSRLKECIDRDYVHIKFTDTRGGTELGVRIDRDASGSPLTS